MRGANWQRGNDPDRDAKPGMKVSLMRVLGGAFVLAGTVLLGGATLVYFLQPTAPSARPVPSPTPVETPTEADLAWQIERLDGAKVRLADFQEKVLFVNNWATWCAPCVREMPAIERLAQRFEGRSVAFIAVSNEGVDTVASFVAKQDWQLPVYTTNARPPAFQTEAIPSTFILDSERRVVVSHIGPADWDDLTTDETLDELLAAPV